MFLSIRIKLSQTIIEIKLDCGKNPHMTVLSKLMPHDSLPQGSGTNAQDKTQMGSDYFYA